MEKSSIFPQAERQRPILFLNASLLSVSLSPCLPFHLPPPPPFSPSLCVSGSAALNLQFSSLSFLSTWIPAVSHHIHLDDDALDTRGRQIYISKGQRKDLGL